MVVVLSGDEPIQKQPDEDAGKVKGAVASEVHYLHGPVNDQRPMAPLTSHVFAGFAMGIVLQVCKIYEVQG